MIAAHMHWVQAHYLNTPSRSVFTVHWSMHSNGIWKFTCQTRCAFLFQTSVQPLATHTLSVFFTWSVSVRYMSDKNLNYQTVKSNQFIFKDTCICDKVWVYMSDDKITCIQYAKKQHRQRNIPLKNHVYFTLQE